MDVNKDGSVSIADFRAHLEKSGIKSADNAFRKYDADGTGSISLMDILEHLFPSVVPNVSHI